MHKSLLSIFLILVAVVSFAQETPMEPEEKTIVFEQPKSDFREKLHYGGNLWLGFFGAFYVDASPMIGYEITDAGTVAGIGATFIYQGGFNSGGVAMGGPRIFIRQPIWRSIFAHAEYEFMNAPANQFYSFDTNNQIGGVIGRKWEGSPLIGGGFYQGRTRQQKGSFISAMYNLGFAFNKGFVSPQGLGGNNSPIVVRFGFFF
ncbi:MAG: hypothetical protein ACI8UX_001750 [Psychromonas sp.]|jgi:hypothetical protein